MIAPLEHLRPRTRESDFEQIVKQDSAECRGDEQNRGVFVRVEPEKHARDEHEDAHVPRPTGLRLIAVNMMSARAAGLQREPWERLCELDPVIEDHVRSRFELVHDER